MLNIKKTSNINNSSIITLYFDMLNNNIFKCAEQILSYIKQSMYIIIIIIILLLLLLLLTYNTTVPFSSHVSSGPLNNINRCNFWFYQNALNAKCFSYALGAFFFIVR